MTILERLPREIVDLIVSFLFPSRSDNEASSSSSQSRPETELIRYLDFGKVFRPSILRLLLDSVQINNSMQAQRLLGAGILKQHKVRQLWISDFPTHVEPSSIGRTPADSPMIRSWIPKIFKTCKPSIKTLHLYGIPRLEQDWIKFDSFKNVEHLWIGYSYFNYPFNTQLLQHLPNLRAFTIYHGTISTHLPPLETPLLTKVNIEHFLGYQTSRLVDGLAKMITSSKNKVILSSCEKHNFDALKRSFEPSLRLAVTALGGDFEKEYAMVFEEQTNVPSQ